MPDKTALIGGISSIERGKNDNGIFCPNKMMANMEHAGVEFTVNMFPIMCFSKNCKITSLHQYWLLPACCALWHMPMRQRPTQCNICHLCTLKISGSSSHPTFRSLGTKNILPPYRLSLMKFWQLHLPALSGGALFAGGLRPSKFDFLQHKFCMDEDVNVGWLQPHSPFSTHVQGSFST